MLLYITTTQEGYKKETVRIEHFSNDRFHIPFAISLCLNGKKIIVAEVLY